MAKTLATRMAFGHELIEIAKTNENFVVCNADTKSMRPGKVRKRFSGKRIFLWNRRAEHGGRSSRTGSLR